MRSTGHNVIILTAGLTGSSVVAALLKDVGYWVGSETAKKPDYDTFENRDLVALNEHLLEEAGYHERHDRVFKREHVDEVIEHISDIDLEPYRQFVQECSLHEPWLWKDPRLWLTIRFWVRLLDRDQLHIVLISRQHSQAWISHILRRHIQTPGYLRNYMEGVRASLLEFIGEHNLPYLEIVYEDLIISPKQTLERLENFLEVKISMSNLTRVYHEPLYRSRHGVLDYIHAVLVYLKNYSKRSRLV